MDKKLQNLLFSIYDLLFPLPKVCPICMQQQKALQICDCCNQDALQKRITFGQCSRCGSFGVTGNGCHTCENWPSYYKKNVSLWPYQERYKDVIRAFKFQNMPWLAEPVAHALLPYLPQQYDLLMPVPLHRKRLQERGYNQSELLVRALSQHSNIPWQYGLERIINTPHQTGLNRTKRLENLHHAFTIVPKADFVGKKIILIDDVCTTGTTLLSCANLLYQYGATEIVSCTLASGYDRVSQ